jgi:hypothetical protein
MMEEFYTTEDGIRRESTEEEIAQILNLRQEIEKGEADKIANEIAKAALLARLGITADEAKLLLS